ncbi:MAG: MFS transporter [Clostridia bacterium]|nr:MFS transporter [Clostridia bacterium]
MTKRREIFLIIICWFSYTLAQLGRYSYGSNVTLIMDRFAVDHAPASLPATLFFFAYGVGQIFVGLFCHKFNRKLLVVSALIISGVINLIIFFGAPFITIKYMWLLNGFAQANLWPVLLLILRENVSPERIGATGIVMATASTGGKFAAIGVCAIFAIDTSAFMYCFLTAGILLFTVAIVFLFGTGKIKGIEIKEKEITQREIPKQKPDKKAIILLLLLGEFSLACYAISRGLQQWIPAIIKESYGMSDALSIFMSVLLPLFTLSVAFISPYLYKKLKNYVLISLIAFVTGAILIAGVLLLLDASWIPVIILFTMEAITMSIVSNTTTVQVPLTFKGKFDAGFLAGYLNGACYIGTAVATYVLGYMADASGWTGAFILLICIAAVSALLAVIYLILNMKKKVDKKVRNDLQSDQTVEDE